MLATPLARSSKSGGLAESGAAVAAAQRCKGRNGVKMHEASTFKRMSITLCCAVAVGILPLVSTAGHGQQPQTQTIPPVSALNSQYVQGVAPGYYPTPGTGLTLNLGPGTSFCNGGLVYYPGGTLSMAPNATNYVYLDAMAGCTPAANVAGLGISTIPVARVWTSSSGITSIVDDRTWFSTGVWWTYTNVGIATASAPVESLEVGSGNIRLDKGYFYGARFQVPHALFNAPGPYWGDIQNDAAGTWSLGYTATAANVLGTPVLSWTSSSRIGIGNVTSPTQTLDVNGSGRFALNTVSFSATPAFDASLGNTQQITLTDNVTSSTLVNASAGEFLYFIICQDATGGRTFAWPANLKGGMTIGATAGTCSAQAFIFNGSNAYALTPGVANQ